MRLGHSFKDMICPDTFEFEKDHFQMGGKYGRVVFLRDYANFIKDNMVSELCGFNRNMILSIDIIPIPTDEAVREVEKRVLGVETNITNWQRKQNTNNNFSAVIPYDMELQRKESKEFLDDLTTRDQRMMFAVMTVVLTADTKEQLESDTETLFTAKAYGLACYHRRHDKPRGRELEMSAENARETAREAKTAVKDAKQILKETQQAGRQTLREVKQRTKAKQSGGQRDAAPNVAHSAGRENPARGGMPKGEPITTGNAPKGAQTPHAAAPKGEAPRPNSGASRFRLERGKKLSGRPKTASTAQGGATPVGTARQPMSPRAGRGIDASPPASVPKSGGITRPNYMSGGTKAAKSTGDAAKTLQTSGKASGKAAKSTAKGFKSTAKGSIKTAKKSVKTAEKSAKAAVKTAQRTAKNAQRAAKVAVKTAKAAERAARAAAKVAAQTAKAAAKAVAAMVKIAIAAVKGLVALIAAGGWIAVAVILIICVVGLLVGSIFGIFFSGEDNGTGYTMPGVVTELSAEFYEQTESIKAGNPHDILDMAPMSINWPEVLAVYAVKVNTDPENAAEVVTLDDKKVERLRGILYDMVSLSYLLSYEEEEQYTHVYGGYYQIDIVTITTLTITLTQKSADEMAAQYGFSQEQKEQLQELLSPEYASLWAQLLGGYIAGNGEILIGNISRIPNDILSWPVVDDWPVTSVFGNRSDPFTNENKFHGGIDISAPEGTPILAAADGFVTVANSTDSWGGGFGYYVKIEHEGGFATLYAHCVKIAVIWNQEVKKGEVIGYVGSTGRSTGNHLHWEVHKDGVRKNPLDYFG